MGSEIEFLLVQTRRGRWTFPKGGVDAGMTRAQAAAMEALEEAGAYGRIEETWFTRYCHRKGGGAGSMSAESIVHAHLCEVLRQGLPDERDRNPTWFPVERAKRRLREDRADDAGDELARVVDRAVARIRRLHAPRTNVHEPLRQVRFEGRPIEAADGFQEF
ncbi:MAG: NUDIX domain-containing protein [Acidobacteria bacterium]|nr:NUDIX domain-containing protein [Acidobacteriota bacterium]